MGGLLSGLNVQGEERGSSSRNPCQGVPHGDPQYVTHAMTLTQAVGVDQASFQMEARGMFDEVDSLGSNRLPFIMTFVQCQCAWSSSLSCSHRTCFHRSKLYRVTVKSLQTFTREDISLDVVHLGRKHIATWRFPLAALHSSS